MLTESFVASVLYAEKPPSTSSALKDASIHLYDFQPLPSLKTSFKKSSTKANCLAISASHVFAAQSDKAAIQVYSRERGNQEAFIPLQEKVSSLALIGDLQDAGILAMGTEGGRLLLWELCTGRIVSTPASHLQEVTCLAVDPSHNFLLSGSADSNIHVWSISQLLSFSSSNTTSYSQKSPYSPTRTLSSHRGGITSLAFGHSHTSANFALSGSRDELCIVWDFLAGTQLHTFLLLSTPLCLILEPADRAFYAGYEDGSVQQVDLYEKAELVQPLRDPALQNTPTQPPSTSRWPSPPTPSPSPTLCLTLSYDSSVLLSGHQNGKVQTWNIAKGTFDTTLTDFSSPVTNLLMLPPTGFPHPKIPSLKLQNVVKPRFGVSSNTNINSHASTSIIPESYTFTAQLLTPPLTPSPNPLFASLISQPTFSESLLSSSLASLLESTNPNAGNPSASSEEADNLRAELSVLRASQAGHADKAIELNTELREIKAIIKEKDRLKNVRRKKREEAEFKWREASIRGEVAGIRPEMSMEEMEEASRLAVEGMQEAGSKAVEEWEAERRKDMGKEEEEIEIEVLSSSTDAWESD